MPKGMTARLDVLHITEAWGGGVRRHLQLIVPELQRRGIKNGIWIFSARAEEDLAKELEAWPTKPTFAQCQKLPVNIWPAWLGAMRKKLQHIVAREKPRWLHLHAGWAGLLGRSVNWPENPKTIYSPHAFGILEGQSWLRRSILPRLEARLAERTSLYVLVGPDEEREAEKMQLPKNKLRLIPNALPDSFIPELLDREQARACLGLTAQTQAVLVPGRLAWQKGGDILLQALHQSKALPPQLLFCFCGQGREEQAWRRQTRKYCLEKSVRFLGYRPDLRRLLLAFDAAILPSRYEGLSYALLECRAAGLPLLVSNIQANLYQTDPQDPQEQTFTAGDSRSLAKILPQFLATGKRRTPRMPRWTLNKQVDDLQEVYADILGAKSLASPS